MKETYKVLIDTDVTGEKDEVLEVSTTKTDVQNYNKEKLLKQKARIELLLSKFERKN